MIIEIVYMLSKKYSPKEILNEGTFKKDLHKIVTDKISIYFDNFNKNIIFLNRR